MTEQTPQTATQGDPGDPGSAPDQTPDEHPADQPDQDQQPQPDPQQPGGTASDPPAGAVADPPVGGLIVENDGDPDDPNTRSYIGTPETTPDGEPMTQQGRKTGPAAGPSPDAGGTTHEPDLDDAPAK